MFAVFWPTIGIHHCKIVGTNGSAQQSFAKNWPLQLKNFRFLYRICRKGGEREEWLNVWSVCLWFYPKKSNDQCEKFEKKILPFRKLYVLRCKSGQRLTPSEKGWANIDMLQTRCRRQPAKATDLDRLFSKDFPSTVLPPLVENHRLQLTDLEHNWSSSLTEMLLTQAAPTPVDRDFNVHFPTHTLQHSFSAKKKSRWRGYGNEKEKGMGKEPLETTLHPK